MSLSPTYGLWVWGTGLHVQGVESRAEVWLRAGQSPKNQTPKLQTPEYIAAGIATNGIPRALGFLNQVRVYHTPRPYSNCEGPYITEA